MQIVQASHVLNSMTLVGVLVPSLDRSILFNYSIARINLPENQVEPVSAEVCTLYTT